MSDTTDQQPKRPEVKIYGRDRTRIGRNAICGTVLNRETLEGVRLHMRMHKLGSLSGAIHDLVRRGLGLPPLH